jgi:uncharacterized membrane protein
MRRKLQDELPWIIIYYMMIFFGLLWSTFGWPEYSGWIALGILCYVVIGFTGYCWITWEYEDKKPDGGIGE